MTSDLAATGRAGPRPARSTRSSANSPIDEESILDSARELLVSVGPEHMAMSDVARHSGCSRATLYRRWPNVQAISAAIMSREVKRIIGEGLTIATTDASYPTNRERVVAGAMAIVQATRKNRVVRSLIDHDPDHFVPYLYGVVDRHELRRARPPHGTRQRVAQRPPSGGYVNTALGALELAARDGSISADANRALLESVMVMIMAMSFISPLIATDLAAVDRAWLVMLDQLLRPVADSSAPTEKARDRSPARRARS